MLKSLRTFAEKREKKMKELDKKRWVKTVDVIEFLKSDPNKEHEFSHYLGGMLRSTYWMEYKSDKEMFALSRDWIRPDYYTEEELLECYQGHWWNLTCLFILPNQYLSLPSHLKHQEQCSAAPTEQGCHGGQVTMWTDLLTSKNILL